LDYQVDTGKFDSLSFDKNSSSTQNHQEVSEPTFKSVEKDGLIQKATVSGGVCISSALMFANYIYSKSLYVPPVRSK